MPTREIKWQSNKKNTKMKPIYLDYNATTPIDPVVVEAMRPYLEEHFGNPSSTHWYGVQAKLAVEKARKQVAELLNCDADEIVFTSGGSESNNYAIKGVAFANRDKGNHIITSLHPQSNILRSPKSANISSTTAFKLPTLRWMSLAWWIWKLWEMLFHRRLSW